MNDIVTWFEIIACTLVVAAPPILLSRFLAGSEPAGLARLFGFPADQPWPRGIQEEEPPRWRPELIQRPAKATDRTPKAAEASRLVLERSLIRYP